jgi:hypothetical protein
MTRVVFERSASLRGVRKVTMVGVGRAGGVKQTVFAAPPDGDVEEGEIKVTLVKPDAGVIRYAEIDDTGPNKKKQSKALRPLEKSMRKIARRQVEIAAAYLLRHERSNRRKKNGWIRDFGANLRRAMRRS